MKLLVTGGCGFIGSNFIRHIFSEFPDYEIVNLDLLTYAGNPANLKDIEGRRGYTFVHGDIGDADTVTGILSGGVDAIVHFAAESHVDRSILDAKAFLHTNVMGTHTLLDAARRSAVSRFIHVSTDEVYGELGETGYFTETTPLAPRSPYAASKAASDHLAMAFFHTFGLPVIITRCCNNFGPYQFPEKLVPLMTINAMHDRPLPVYGRGLNVRDWIHVVDHCRAVDAVLHRGRPGEVYNIGARCEKENIEVVRRILAILGKPDSLIAYVTDRPGHDHRYAIDPSKIETEMGWRAERSFDSALEETVLWYREHRGWWEAILSGAYREYYRQQYEEREKTARRE